jgi:hypothetical protein
MNFDDLPRFPVPPSSLDAVVSTAYFEVNLQVQRSTIAAKKALGLDVEEDELELHLAESSAEYHDEADACRHHEAVWSHLYATRRPRECAHQWPDAGEATLTTSQLKEAAIYWKRAFIQGCHSDPDPNFDGEDSERRGPDEYTMFMDFLAALPDSDIDDVLREKDVDAWKTWTLVDARNAEARLLAQGCVVEPEWLQAIFSGSAEQADELTRDAILRMGRCGFSPTFTAAARWLYDHTVHKMPVSMDAGLAFLRVLAERDVAAQVPDENAKLMAERIDALTPGAAQGFSAGSWAVAANILATERAMRSVITNASSARPVAVPAVAPTHRARRALV